MPSEPSALTRWGLIILVGVITAVSGAVLAAGVGSWAADVRNVSKFEGQSGFLVAFVFLPLGFLIGLVAGIYFAWHGGVFNLPALSKQLGLALLVTAGIIGAAGGINYVTADHAPKIDGHKLDLEFEIRMPAGRVLPKDLSTLHLGVNLEVNHANDRGAFLRLNEAGERDGRTIIPGSISLLSTDARRLLYVAESDGAGKLTHAQFFQVALPAKPRKEDEQWSAWITHVPASQISIPSMSPPGPAEKYEVRYRIQETR